MAAAPPRNGADLESLAEMDAMTQTVVWNDKKPHPFEWNRKTRRLYREQGIRTQYVYPDGSPVQFGIWNGMTRRFVFGIRADTPGQARREAHRRMGDNAYRWRYEVAIIPQGWKNPQNQDRRD